MKKKKNQKLNLFLSYVVIAVIGILLLYPILWMFFAAFKTNEEIYGSTRLLPSSFSFQNFVDGWKGSGVHTYSLYFLNTFKIVIPVTFLTLISSTLAAYAFERFRFRGKNILFAVMIALLMLPNSVLMIPRYTMYSNWGWINTYLPFYVPAALASNSFFIYMLVQFLHGVPRELDESARIDGCGSFRILVQILLPLMKPSLFSAGLFQFMWCYNDYLNQLIFINSGEKYTVSLALRLSIDGEAIVNWGRIMAISFITVLPLMILFFAAQKYFVEGIATSGLKG